MSTEGREQDDGLRNAKEPCSWGIGPVKHELARRDADLVALCVREDAEGHARYVLGGLGWEQIARSRWSARVTAACAILRRDGRES
jgi:hypothetical protein